MVKIARSDKKSIILEEKYEELIKDFECFTNREIISVVSRRSAISIKMSKD
jgi:hypothetical protein